MDNNSKKKLLDQIEQALGQVNFGSVEIIVQDKKVTQISVRSIQKTSIDIPQAQQSIPTDQSKQDIQNQKILTIQARFRRRTD